MEEEVTSDWLKKELEVAEKRLTRNEERQQRQRTNGDGDRIGTTAAETSSPLKRLFEINDELDCLKLAQDLAVWTSADEPSNVMEEARHCIDLSKILCKSRVPPANTTARRSYDALLTQEYHPLHRYVQSNLIMALRKALHQVGYPSTEASSKLQVEFQTFDETNNVSAAACCFWLSRLQKANSLVGIHIHGETAIPTERSDVVVELCRPLVDRVQFHFVKQSDERLTSKRIERLPEWVLGYIREHAFEGGPWDLVQGGIAKMVDAASFQFVTEMVHLAQYVMVERNFFRCSAVAGPNSNPLYLTQGIEQLLRFDSYIRDLVGEQQLRLPVGLSQSLIASDEELWTWFLNREREATLSTLLDADAMAGPSLGLDRISPRSEIFCALIYSIRSKTRLFETPGPYLKHVAVPLCTTYLDVVHDTSTTLRDLMSHRKLPSDEDLKNNVEMWIELINGMNAAASCLLKGTVPRRVGMASPTGVTASDHDLARVGRSFEQLRKAMIEECTTTIVETLLNERARLTSYLMRCSHVLASSDAVANNGLSPDLSDVAHILSLIVDTCTRSMPNSSSDDVDQFDAAATIRLNVIDGLADQFLDVCIDADGMTPELVLQGCLVVAEDVKTLFKDLRSPQADRLSDVSTFMTMESKAMHGLRMALFGLSSFAPSSPHDSPSLIYSHFASDGTLLNEATSMIRAKGYGIHLEDAIAILNRRTDSFDKQNL